MEEVGSALRKHLGEQAAAAKLDTWSAIAKQLDDRGGEVVRPKVDSSPGSTRGGRGDSSPRSTRGGQGDSSPRSKRWVRPIAAVGAALALVATMLIFFSPSAPRGASVESIDFGEASGLLFQMHDSNTTVIWQTTNEDAE
jgi:hypothetical protein